MINARSEYIRGLRDFADFLEAYPEVKLPVALAFNAFVEGREELADHARAAPPWEKVYHGDWFSLRKTFGPVNFEVNVDRSVVCRKTVTGQRIIPAQVVEEVIWECDESPLLAESTGVL